MAIRRTETITWICDWCGAEWVLSKKGEYPPDWVAVMHGPLGKVKTCWELCKECGAKYYTRLSGKLTTKPPRGTKLTEKGDSHGN